MEVIKLQLYHSSFHQSKPLLLMEVMKLPPFHNSFHQSRPLSLMEVMKLPLYHNSSHQSTPLSLMEVMKLPPFHNSFHQSRQLLLMEVMKLQLYHNSFHQSKLLSLMEVMKQQPFHSSFHQSRPPLRMEVMKQQPFHNSSHQSRPLLLMEAMKLPLYHNSSHQSRPLSLMEVMKLPLYHNSSHQSRQLLLMEVMKLPLYHNSFHQSKLLPFHFLRLLPLMEVTKQPPYPNSSHQLSRLPNTPDPVTREERLQCKPSWNRSLNSSRKSTPTSASSLPPHTAREGDSHSTSRTQMTKPSTSNATHGAMASSENANTVVSGINSSKSAPSPPSSKTARTLLVSWPKSNPSSPPKSKAATAPSSPVSTAAAASKASPNGDASAKRHSLAHTANSSSNREASSLPSWQTHSTSPSSKSGLSAVASTIHLLVRIWLICTASFQLSPSRKSWSTWECSRRSTSVTTLLSTFWSRMSLKTSTQISTTCQSSMSPRTACSTLFAWFQPSFPTQDTVPRDTMKSSPSTTMSWRNWSSHWTRPFRMSRPSPLNTHTSSPTFWMKLAPWIKCLPTPTEPPRLKLRRSTSLDSTRPPSRWPSSLCLWMPWGPGSSLTWEITPSWWTPELVNSRRSKKSESSSVFLKNWPEKVLWWSISCSAMDSGPLLILLPDSFKCFYFHEQFLNLIK